MKLIGILSDTHSCLDDRYSIHFKDCDEIWHAGDIGDISILQQLRDICPVVRAVRGNIDHGQVARCCPEVEIFTVENINVLMTHIGGYPTRYAPGIKQMLTEHHTKLFISGHSHILRIMPDAALDLLHINPGAAGNQGWQKVRTLVRLTLDNGDMRDLDVIELGKLKV